MDNSSLILTLLNMNGWGPKRVFDYIRKYCFDYEQAKNGLVLELDDYEKNDFKSKYVKVKEIISNNLSKGIKTCSILDPVFPKKLYAGKEKCVFLYYVGNIELLNTKSITIVGTRKPDEEFALKGKVATEYFAKKGYTIVSGLALGCDTIAHANCVLNNGNTIAILPSPCDDIQPVTNRKLAYDIVETGGLLISEYGTGEPFNKYNYAARDRIQSLLSNVLLVIQSTDEGGTRIAVKKSLDDNKHVYAIKGNNLKLVKEYIDVENVDDLKKVESHII